MIGYVTIGTSDMEKAKQFYTDLLSEIGYSVTMDMGRIAFLGKEQGQPMLALCTPYNEENQDCGNGNMVAIDPGSKEMVDKLHAKALELGATNDGDPGSRIEGVFYGAYFRDPDGNKMAFYQFG